MQTDKDRSGVYFLIAIPLVALALWLLAPSVSLSISSWYDAFSLLGKATGIVGMMLFAESMILSARLSVFEKFFYGLNKVYEKLFVFLLS
ncbi:MAG: hypothetical protein ACKOW9_01115 [Candidatus Paceibacterota bacterium]